MTRPGALAKFAATHAALLLLVALAWVPGARAQQSAATADGALGTLFNPALIGLRYPSELLLSSSFDEFGDDQRWDALAAWRNFGLRYSRWPGAAQVGGFTLAAGDPKFRLGWSSEWSGPDLAGADLTDHRLGVLSRPAPFLSLGATVDHLFQPSYAGRALERRYGLAAAVRPLSLPLHTYNSRMGRSAHGADGSRFTVSADASIREDQFRQWSATALKPHWRVGFDMELIQGIAVRYQRENQQGNIGVVFRLPRLAFSANAANNRSAYTLSLHSGEDDTRLVPPGAKRVGVVGLHGPLGDDDLAGFSLLYGGESSVPTGPLHERLERALDDRLTRGVLLDLGGVSNSAALEELRPDLLKLRAAGKPVVAYLENGGGRADLLIASACDRVVASEEAMFWSLGLRVERRYYRKFLADLGLRMDRSSIGAYKSAYRNFSVDSTPPADREVIEHAIDFAQASFVGTVAEARRMDRRRLETLLDGRAWSSSDLASAGLIDSVGYREDALRQLGQLAKLGRRPRPERLAAVRHAERAWAPARGLAVIYASGGIEMGESGNDLFNGPTLGATTLIRQIESAFRRAAVKAVVLRVESPGGSVLASDLIYHALERMKRETKKPLVVSMGSVAASGGYYIAIPGQRIFADRYTRTGSIGVVFTKPSFEGWYAKHGVKQEDFERGAWMRGNSFARDWDAATQASADSATARTYARFVDRVAAARSLPRERVLEVAQGRVWMGEEARERGLIDEIGGLDAAIAWAKRAAHIPAGAAIDPVEYRRPRPGLLQRVAGSWVRATLAREAQLPLGPDLRYEAGDDLEF